MSEDYLDALSRFAIESAHAQSVTDVLWLLTNDIVASLGFEDCVVYLTDRTECHLQQVAAFGNKSSQPHVIDNPITLAFGQGITGRAASEQRSMLVNDVREDPDYVIDDQQRLSELAVPIVVAGKTIGVIDSEHSQTHFYTKRHQQTLEALSSIIAAKYQQARLLQELKKSEEEALHLATHDALTELPNRAQFLLWAKESLDQRCGQTTYLGMIDLDRFKSVNDRYGHEVGDTLLCEVSRRFQSIFPKHVRFARLGGDEFAFIAELDSLAVRELASGIVQCLAEPINLTVDLVLVGASVGIALLDERVEKVSHWLRRADAMLYQQKALGESGVMVYPEGDDHRVPIEVVIHTELSRVIDTKKLDIALQPIIRMNTARVLGFEALVRWTHPSYGPIRPDQFIPLAERSGLIRILDACVIEKTAQLFDLIDDDQYISINLSSASLSMLEQNEVLMNLAHRMGERLCVEVTERSMVANFELASKALQRLRELGVKVFLDDFGTGYSSLSYLHKLPVDTLKIDQSFIRNLSANTPEESLVRTIAALAASLDLDVIAEGVETFEQQCQLQALGLQKAQGYLYGKPELRELPALG